MNTLLLIAIPMAALLGRYSGRKKGFKNTIFPTKNKLPPDYYIGLQYLINEQPDQAVNTFIKLLEVTDDTFETHLILGSLFRRRGEADRAIRIHQNLLARPQLNTQQRTKALSELAQDYLRAGVLDRAERLFLELINIDENLMPNLHHLLHIYQQGKDWEHAISIAKKMSPKNKQSMHFIIAHYHCELAELASEKKQFEQAHKQLKLALGMDSCCVRAYLLKAKLEMMQGNYKLAIRSYQQVKQQDAEFISEIISPLALCYEQLGLETDLLEYLYKCLKEYPRISIALLLSEYLYKREGNRVAIEFMSNQIKQYPSLRGVQQLVNLYRENSFGDARDKLTLLHDLISKLLGNKPIYRCIQCGFAAKTLYWQCPQCREWSSVKPIHGLEGD